MNRNELAKTLGVTPKTLFDWQKRGMPKRKKQLGLWWRWDFDLDEVKAWLKKEKG